MIPSCVLRRRWRLCTFFLSMYRQATRGMLCLCRDVTCDEVCFVDTTVVSFDLEEHFGEIGTLCALQALLAPHSTLWTFSHTVVHLNVSRVCCQAGGSRSVMEVCL